MRSLLILFTLISFSQAQFIETFNDFTGHLNDSTKGKWVFGSGYAGSVDSIGNDQSGNNNNLTASVGFDYASQLTGTSPVYKNDNALVFDGLNDYWYIPAAQAGDFNPGVGDFTIEGWITTSNDIMTNMMILSKRSSTVGYQTRIYNGNLDIFLLTNNGNVSVFKSISINTTYYFAAVYDKDGNLSLFLDKESPATASISAYSAENITNVNNLNIGSRDTGGQYFNGEISSVTYHAKALTADEIKENYALGYGWSSENANVKRDTMDWFQGFADTVYTSTGITGNCKIKFNAWGQNGGETLEVWSGSTSRSFTLTDTKKLYSASLQMADGLYFASTDTVYIDDIKSGKVQKGYLQYLQYNDYIGAGGSCKEGVGSFPYYFNMFLN